MFECVSVFRSSGHEVVSVKQVIDNADIKEVEARCLYQGSLDGFGISGYHIAD